MIDADPQSLLRRIDAHLRPEHHFLQGDDDCWFLLEYRPGAARVPVGRLIVDLKYRPAQLSAHPILRRRKERALHVAAQLLRAAVPRSWAEEASWCPIPPSVRLGDADYDDRLERLLRLAFAGYDADVRPALQQAHTAPADHRGSRRLKYAQLYALTRLEASLLAQRPLRSQIVLFDDLLTTGKHFKCGQVRWHEWRASLPIRGFFLARRQLSLYRRGLAIGSLLSGARATSDYAK